MPDFTYWGVQYALFGNNASDGSIARMASAIKLYTAASVPKRTGVEGIDFLEVADGNGYAAGGHAIDVTNWQWSISAGKGRITLADQTWTATTGPIANVAGSYLVDQWGRVLGWWERQPFSALAGEPLTISGVYCEF